MGERKEMHTCYNCFEEYNGEGTFCPQCGYNNDENAAKEKYPLALRQGSIIGGKYIVGRVLGQGGFGITYVAQDYDSKEKVAIKEYFPGDMITRTGNTYAVAPFSSDSRENFNYGKECFLAEAKTLAEFQDSKGIVTVYRYFEENGTAYLAMEFVEGESLEKYIKNNKGGRLQVEEANRIMFPIMEALEQVHAKGVIHRDIAPDNIIITNSGEPKLIDFGAARYSMGEKSQSLDVILKHGFAPFEQYARHGRQGPYTDIYALAATYYYAITGQVPPDSIDLVNGEKITPPSQLGADTWPALESVLMKALAVKHEDRYQTMAEFQNDLQKAILDRSRSKIVADLQTPNKNDNKKLIGGILAVVVALAVLGTVGEKIAQSKKNLSSTSTGTQISTAKPDKKVKAVKEGEYVKLGTYEQNGAFKDGSEEIEWIVVKVDGDKALLLSRYALDCRDYDDYKKDKYTTWENSKLREWLNNNFLYGSFDENEQKMILETELVEDGLYDVDKTKDMVFILSIKEADDYLANSKDRACLATEYVKSQGAYISSTGGSDYCWWWLRTITKYVENDGNPYTQAAWVNDAGNINKEGTIVYPGGNCVRPAIWIKLGEIESYEDNTASSQENSNNNSNGVDLASSVPPDVNETNGIWYKANNTDTSTKPTVVRYFVENGRQITEPRVSFVDDKMLIEFEWQNNKDIYATFFPIKINYIPQKNEVEEMFKNISFSGDYKTLDSKMHCALSGADVSDASKNILVCVALDGNKKLVTYVVIEIDQSDNNEINWIVANNEPDAKKPVVRRCFVANGMTISNVKAEEKYINDFDEDSKEQTSISFDYDDNSTIYYTLISSFALHDNKLEDFEISFEDSCSNLIPIWKDQISWSNLAIQKNVGVSFPSKNCKSGIQYVMMIATDIDFNPITYLVFEIDLP